jgi:hypothetical protein
MYGVSEEDIHTIVPERNRKEEKMNYDNTQQEVITFTYNGGSEPGSLRIGYVNNIEGGVLYTWDFVKSGFRNFNVGLMQGVRIISQSEGVLITPSETIVKDAQAAYVQSCRKAGWDVFQAEHALVSVNLATLLPQETVSLNYEGKTITFSGKNGSWVWYIDFSIGMDQLIANIQSVR